MKKIIIIIVSLVVIGGIVFAVVKKGKPEVEYTAVAVVKSDIVQSVSETGTVKSSDEINLSFLSAGKIDKINFAVGDLIERNQVLAELDCQDLEIKKKETEAGLDSARATYNKLLAGPSREDINVAKAAVQQAKIAYETAEKEMERTRETVTENIAQAEKTLFDLESSDPGNITASEQAVINAEIALENTKLSYQSALDNQYENAKTVAGEKLSIANNALDTIYGIVNDDDLKTQLSVKDSSYLINTNKTYKDAVELLKIANASLSALKTGNGPEKTVEMLDEVKAVLEKVFSSLKYCYSALENTVASAAVSQTEIDSLKSGISADQTLVTTAISAIQTSHQGIDSAVINYNTYVSSAQNTLSQAKATYNDALKTARNALSSAKVSGNQQITSAQSRTESAFENWQLAQSRYEQTTAPANRNDLLSAQAKIDQVNSSLDSIQRSMENCLIKSPINGMITKINFEVGEYPGIGSPAISILGENNYEIEALISEADIAKISKGNEAEITLDAFGEDVKFKGEAAFIEPAETVIQDVIYYKVKIAFVGTKEEFSYLENVKSGMTANISIVTARKSDVLVMPIRAVIDRNGEGRITRVLNPDNTISEQKITLGLRGDSGLVEVVSGVKAGDKVVTYVKE